MAIYTPRDGDTVKVELELSEGVLDFLGTCQGVRLDWTQLLADGKVELVSRAEPDWQHGDFGRHVETGDMFRYLPGGAVDPEPWLRCTGDSGDRWVYRSNLAGKLERCKVVPEEATPAGAGPAGQPHHVHRCYHSSGPMLGPGSHLWEHGETENRDPAECDLDFATRCGDHV